ncbi:MAG: branched chain amino acid aminotransferase [bacterium]|nr:MAG: branched chain amino acid aminotransferase [bacterium]
MVQSTKFIWFDGKMVPWERANVHVLTHTLHYGLGIFEGIRCYNTDNGPAIFRLKSHTKRFLNSAHILNMKIPFSFDELYEATKETVKQNNLKECYIRPLGFIGYGDMGLYPQHNKIQVAIAAWPWGTYLGKEGIKNGIRVKVSSFTRNQIDSSMTKSKTCGNYVNSQLAKWEAIDAGYDEAILLDSEGYASEGSAECLFAVRDGIIYTPPFGTILEGITRSSVVKIAEDLGYRVKEDRLTRDQLYVSDELFLAGTAAEITPIRDLDGRTIGNGSRGEITEKIQLIYFDAVHGNKKEYRQWLDFV